MTAPGLNPVCVDAMGGDSGPGVVVRAAIEVSRRGVPVALVGEARALAPWRDAANDAGVTVWSVPEGEAVDEDLVGRSAVRAGLAAVRDGRAGAFVSCGATGVVLVESVRMLGVWRASLRPALAIELPTFEDGWVVLVDAGANVECRARHLVDFAELGAAWMRVALGVNDPRIALLSNGEEDAKGTPIIREAARAMRDASWRVVGQREPYDVLRGDCDVVVCDGLIGNIMLKSMEAIADRVMNVVPPGPVTEALERSMSWRHRGAAALLGVRGLVWVAHGRSDQLAVERAILRAWDSVHKGVLAELKSTLGEDVRSSS